MTGVTLRPNATTPLRLAVWAVDSEIIKQGAENR